MWGTRPCLEKQGSAGCGKNLCATVLELSDSERMWRKLRTEFRCILFHSLQVRADRFDIQGDPKVSINFREFINGWMDRDLGITLYFIWPFIPLTSFDSIKSEVDAFIRNYWVFGLCPSSGILKNTTFRKLDLFPSSSEGVGDTCSVESVRKR
jgi:hypothetical protein